jgi:hypothetical protein
MASYRRKQLKTRLVLRFYRSSFGYFFQDRSNILWDRCTHYVDPRVEERSKTQFTSVVRGGKKGTATSFNSQLWECGLPPGSQVPPVLPLARRRIAALFLACL